MGAGKHGSECDSSRTEKSVVHKNFVGQKFLADALLSAREDGLRGRYNKKGKIMPNTLRVSWDPNPASDQVLNYELFQSANDAAFVSLGQNPATSRDVSVGTGVYRFKVKALNVAGAGPESDIGSGPDVPQKPSTPVVTTVVP